MASHIERRKFLAALGSATAWPLAARDPQGVLMSVDGHSRLAAFLNGLQQLGWTDGRNVRIDVRWGAGDAERTRNYVAGLAALRPQQEQSARRQSAVDDNSGT
jgi:putative ABC transport system substrate-binding protein